MRREIVEECRLRVLVSQLGPAWIAEHRFHDTRKWRFDFADPDALIALEVEGGVHTQGRHTRGKGFLADMEKYNTAVSMGWRVFRTTPDRFLTDNLCQMILAVYHIDAKRRQVS